MHHFIKMAVYISCLIHLLAQPKAFAQNDRLYAIESLPLEVSAARTVSLSFAAAVKSVDRGSAELLAQKAKGTENVVLIKAAREEMEPTSLLVITADGDLHVFEVRYQQQPSSIGLQIMPSRQQPLAAQMPKTIDQNQIQQALKLAADQPPNLRRKSLAGDVSLEVDGLYIAGAVMYLRLSLENRSVIDYQIETLRFLASDNKQIRRSASQQDELLPIGGSVATDQIRASEQKTLVVALAKMTLPESKSLLVQLTEHSGSRHITVRLKAKHLAKIARIPSVSNL
ncbi:conjugative transposon protein TraN [Dyadobacter endophyticus]|uniref:conjugative transposon protein TraN n=1 Tax=Dyadobacter TaxID=120831 RepID=UPI003CE673AA